MSHDCLFCGIVAGDVPGRIVHETDDTVAFLDVNPLAEGHTLVVPRAHRKRIGDLAPAEAGALFRAVADVVPAVETALDAPATTVAVNNGPAAGQEIDHVHVHIVPRYHSDGAGPIHRLFSDRPTVGEERMDDLAAAISAEF
ncbi:MAG: HIT family protein [Salinirussus sp.]